MADVLPTGVPSSVPLKGAPARDMKVLVSEAKSLRRRAEKLEHQCILIARAVLGTSGIDPDVLLNDGWTLEINDDATAIEIINPQIPPQVHRE